MPRPLPLPRILLRRYSSATDPKTIINIPKSNITLSVLDSRSSPVLNEYNTPRRLRLSPSPPAPGGIFPFLTLPNPTLDPLTKLGIVSFTHRRRAGGFLRLYSTVRCGEEGVDVPEEELKVFEELWEDGTEGLLDLPLVALSNGQMRRARIVKAILRKPELLLLDEPLSTFSLPLRINTNGCVRQRDRHARTTSPTPLLHQLHESRAPRIYWVANAGCDSDWITTLLLLGGGEVLEEARKRERDGKEHTVFVASGDRFVGERAEEKKEGEVLMKMEGVSVKYGPRVVLKDINWTIRQGERWHLQGANGRIRLTPRTLRIWKDDAVISVDGKAFGCPLFLAPPPPRPQHRSLNALPHLTQPTNLPPPPPPFHPNTPSKPANLPPLSELYDAFPRKHPGMSVWEAVATGSMVDSYRKGLMDLGTYGRWKSGNGRGYGMKEEEDVESHQRLTLLARALVAHAPIVILDEVWSGMDEESVERVRGYLRDEGPQFEPGSTHSFLKFYILYCCINICLTELEDLYFHQSTEFTAFEDRSSSGATPN
ncbi:hypothetical protein BDQ17DRAFT_1330910 [Cyathus striatus]|nr:hypothetical protein BDQ17DRAFT_1330910 [Cyathus striatus]